MIGYDRLRSDLKTLHALVDRAVLGPRFHKKTNRSEAIFFVEGEENLTLHVHSYWRIDEKNASTFEALFPVTHREGNLWQSIVSSGTYCLKPNDLPYAAAAYLTKEQHIGIDDRRLIFSADFIPDLTAK